MTIRAAAMLVFAASAAWPYRAVAQAAPRAEIAALFAAEHLDVLSIPSSIYPRRRPGANTLKDYGFVRFEKIDGGVRSIDRDKGWLFGVKIVEDNGGIKVLCIQDQALNGGSDLSQNPIEVKLGPDGLFHGTGRIPQSDQCPPYQR